MEITVNWIFGIIVTCAGGFITWSLKNLYGQFQNDKAETRKIIEEFSSQAKENIKQITLKIEKLEERLPEKYALKVDFYREINKLDSKMDYIREDITELNKNVSSLIALQEQILKNEKGGGHIMNFEIDSEKERGWILRILNRVYPDPLDVDTIKRQLIELRFLTSDSDIRGNIAYLSEKGFIKIEEVGNITIKRTVAALTANGKDLIDGAVPAVVGVSV